MPLIRDGVEALEAYLKRIREKRGLVPGVCKYMGKPEVRIVIEVAGGKDVSDWVTFKDPDAFVKAVADIYEKNNISQWQKYAIGCKTLIGGGPARIRCAAMTGNESAAAATYSRGDDQELRVRDETPDIASAGRPDPAREAEKQRQRRMLEEGCGVWQPRT
jgi:hypothetical protein